MNKPDGRPRRNADKDLSELVRILGKLDFEDFMSLFKIFENYRDKTSSLRIIRLLYDALSIGRVRQVKALAPTLSKGRQNLGALNSEYELDILDSGLTERMRHKI